MLSEKSAALKIKDMLTLCLADAIEQAMLTQAGINWFSAFAKYDASPECKTPILQPHQTSVRDCDMQALLKILRYREPYADAVLEYYGFFSPDDHYGNTIKKGHFQHLLNRLITDFRNRMEAHTRAADLRADAGAAMLYDYNDAVTDMLKLAEIFAAVKDGAGVSYYGRMKQVADELRAQRAVTLYSIPAIIQSERLSVDSGEVVRACEKLGIAVVTSNGTLCISTADGAADIRRIRDQLELFAVKRAGRKTKIGIVIAVLIALLTIAGAIAVCVWTLGRDDNTPSRTDNDSSYTDNDDDSDDNTPSSKRTTATTTTTAAPLVGIDVQAHIDNFYPDGFNTFTLAVGATHKPLYANWVQNGNGATYSTDTSVVTVSAYGLVTAVGPGEAYVFIQAPYGGVCKVVRYTVVEP